MPPEDGPQVLRRLRHTAGITERPPAQDRLAGDGASCRLQTDTSRTPPALQSSRGQSVRASPLLWASGSLLERALPSLVRFWSAGVSSIPAHSHKSPGDAGGPSLFSTAGPPPSSTSQPPPLPFPNPLTPFLACFPITEWPPPLEGG